MNTLKVSVSGVRGIVGESLTVPLVSGFASAFGSYVGPGRIIVGRDTRPSGAMLEHAVIAGLLAVGCEPILVGITPTPTVLMLVEELRANGGICITASHNPIEWNAMKFVGPDGLFLTGIQGNELLDIYNQETESYVGEGDLRKIYRIDTPFTYHSRRILDLLDLPRLRAARFKVAVDCCNGVGAPFSRPFLESLGCEVVAINDTADGVFNRGPEPVPENLGALGEAVRQHGCALGFAQDPDGDRLAIVDCRGEPIGEAYSVVLAVAHLLDRAAPGDSREVVVNLATSKAVEDVTRAAGGRLTYSKIGEIHVTTAMLARQAIAGGEGNGGVIWPAVHPCRDSFSAMALILEMMAGRGQSLDQILDSIPRYFAYAVKLKCSAENAQRIVRRLRETYADRQPVTLDGIRIDWEDRWVLIRPSNTEPVLRINTEARSPEAAKALADEFRAVIEAGN